MLKGSGDWVQYRQLPGKMREVDFHPGRRDPSKAEYGEAMAEVYSDGLAELRKAQEAGCDWVLFRHGCSTSRPGATTARSQLRALLRSGDSSPFVVKARSIQHDTVLVAAIRKAK